MFGCFWSRDTGGFCSLFRFPWTSAWEQACISTAALVQHSNAFPSMTASALPSVSIAGCQCSHVWSELKVTPLKTLRTVLFSLHWMWKKSKCRVKTWGSFLGKPFLLCISLWRQVLLAVMNPKCFKYYMTFPTWNEYYIRIAVYVLLKCGWRLRFLTWSQGDCWSFLGHGVSGLTANSCSAGCLAGNSLTFSGQELHKAFRYFWNVLTKIFRKLSENNVSAQEILTLLWGVLLNCSFATFLIAWIRIVQKANGKSCKWYGSGCCCKGFQRMTISGLGRVPLRSVGF